MKKIIFGFISIMSFQVMADLPVYYWDNQDKLVEANDKCKIETLSDQKFRISNYYADHSGAKQAYENLRNFKGIKQSYLSNRSIVKIIDGPEKGKHHLIEVVGVNQSISSNRWYSERGDKGYLFYRSVLPMEDFVIELKNSEIPGIENTHLADSGKTYWSIASGKSFYRLKCPELESKREYIIFRVFEKGGLAPEMLVAVHWGETSLFEKPVTISKYKVGNVLPDFLQAKNNINYVSMSFKEKSIKDTADADEAERLHSEDLRLKDLNAGVGSIEDVVCTPSATLNVRGDNLDEVLFSANPGEKVKVFQSWDDEDKKKTIGGVEYTFKKVQFSEREGKDQSVGWVAYRFIKPKSKCPYVNGNRIVFETDQAITGLDDPNCCEFPTVKKVTHPFTSGMRKFKAGRSGGRLHAACDLYRYENEEIIAVAPGKIIQGVEYFYLGTYSLVIEHSGGFVVRYGEITSKKAKNIAFGNQVKMGQRVGYIGQVGLDVRPMLHFEMYDGSQTGPLTIKVNAPNKFQRRTDLMDPTKYLLKWETSSF